MALYALLVSTAPLVAFAQEAFLTGNFLGEGELVQQLQQEKSGVKKVGKPKQLLTAANKSLKVETSTPENASDQKAIDNVISNHTQSDLNQDSEIDPSNNASSPSDEVPPKEQSSSQEQNVINQPVQEQPQSSETEEQSTLATAPEPEAPQGPTESMLALMKPVTSFDDLNRSLYQYERKWGGEDAVLEEINKPLRIVPKSHCKKKQEEEPDQKPLFDFSKVSNPCPRYSFDLIEESFEGCPKYIVQPKPIRKRKKDKFGYPICPKKVEIEERCIEYDIFPFLAEENERWVIPANPNSKYSGISFGGNQSE